MRSIIFLGLLLLAGTAASAQVKITQQWRLGGNNYEGPSSITPTPDGGTVITIVTHSTNLEGFHGSFDVCLFKLDSEGEEEWQRCYGGSANDNAGQLLTTADGGYLLVGSTASSDGDAKGWHSGYNPIVGESFYDVWIVKLNADGEIEWQRCLGGSGDDFARGVCATEDGYAIAASTSSSDGDLAKPSHERIVDDAWAVGIDTAGHIRWQQTIGGSGPDCFTGVVATGDGGALLSGRITATSCPIQGAYRNRNPGDQDMLVARVDRNGNVLWQRCLGGSGIESSERHQPAEVQGGWVISGKTTSVDDDLAQSRGRWPDSLSRKEALWIVQIDSTGAITRQQVLETGTFGSIDVGSLCAFADGRLLIAATRHGQKNGSDPEGWNGWLVLLAPDWIVEWEGQFGGSRDDGLEIVIHFRYHRAGWRHDTFDRWTPLEPLRSRSGRLPTGGCLAHGNGTPVARGCAARHGIARRGRNRESVLPLGSTTTNAFDSTSILRGRRGLK